MVNWRPCAAVLLALGMCCAIAVAGAPAAGASTPRVSVFGDSVLLGARDQITAQLAPLEVTIDAHESLSLLGAIDGFRAQASSMGDVVVLDLGYNDMADPLVFRQRIDLAMAALASIPRVIWLNQRVFADGRAAMNAELVAAATRYPNLDVADWDAVVRAGTGLVYDDGIHLTPAGQVAMGALVHQRVDAYVASTQPAAPVPQEPQVTQSPVPVPAADSPAPVGSESSAAASPRHTRPDADPPDLLLAGIAIAALAFLIGVGLQQHGWRRAAPGTLDT